MKTEYVTEKLKTLCCRPQNLFSVNKLRKYHSRDRCNIEGWFYAKIP